MSDDDLQKLMQLMKQSNQTQSTQGQRPDQDLIDQNAAAEYAGTLGNKNQLIPLNQQDGKEQNWYPAQAVQAVEPDKFERLKQLLNSTNSNPPNFRN